LDHEKFMGLVAKFEQTFGGRQGLRCAHAPGRVNLIGEHTDYNGGFVMPMAIDRQARVLFRPADRGPVRLWSENCGEWDEFDLDRIERNESPGSGWTGSPLSALATWSARTNAPWRPPTRSRLRTTRGSAA
jgi:galactokinase